MSLSRTAHGRAFGQVAPAATLVLCLFGCGGGKSQDSGFTGAPATTSTAGSGDAGKGNDATSGSSLGGDGGPGQSLGGDGAPSPTGSSMCPTSVSGTVYDPALKNPLYNIVVYVPSQTPSALPQGASCDSCDALYTGNPIASALTDASGHFTMNGVPAGASVPLVIQVGKWRKQMTIPVTGCQDNPQPDKSLSLPTNHMEGDIPNIAISTGNADTLECLLARIGVDEAEYMPGATGPGRIHIFQGGGLISNLAGGAAPTTSPAAPVSSTSLWDSDTDIMPYDITLLSCEGSETATPNQQVLVDYTSAGGRVFASHFHYAWFNSGPFSSDNLATWTPGANSIGNPNATIVTTLPSGQPFPKGLAMQQWLMNVGALTNGELPIADGKHNADVSMSNSFSQPWLVADMSSQAPGATQYFSFDTPYSSTSPCGRVVFSDLHVGAASGDQPSMPVPMECALVDLSPQEKALEFMLFDLSSCLVPDSQPPAPPPVTPQ